MNDNILIPYFARLPEYFGLWLIEPTAAERMRRLTTAADFVQHVQAAVARPSPVDSPMSLVPGKGKNQLALVRLTGSLMKGQSSMGGTSTIAARRAIRQAASDPTVSGIMLAIDSPGGTVAGTADLAADVRLASRRKPVFAQIDDLGASAAYWIASQADQVFASNNTTLVGSIGTVLQLEDSSAKAEKDGVKEIAITSGPLKAWGGSLGFTEEQMTYLQGIVTALQAEFGGAVQKGRALTDLQLQAVSSGAAFPAAEAQKKKLIDGIRPLDASLEMLAKA